MSYNSYGSGNYPGGSDPSQGQGYPSPDDHSPHNNAPQDDYQAQGYQPQYPPVGNIPLTYSQPTADENYARYQQGYGAPPPPATPVRKGRGPLPFIAAIVVIAALAVGGYFLWQNVASPLISGVAYDKLLPNTTMGYFSYDASPSAAQQANWNKVRDAFFSQPGVKDKFDQLGQEIGMGSGMAGSFVQQCSTGNSVSSGGSLLTNLPGFLSGNVTFAYLQPSDAEVRQVVKDAIQSSPMMNGGMMGSGLGGNSTIPNRTIDSGKMSAVACEALALFENHSVAVVELNVNPLDKNSIIAKLQDKTSDANKGSLTKDETYNGTDIYKIDLGGNTATFYGLLIGKEAVLAANKDTLKTIVDAYKDGSKSLSSNANYIAALAKLPADRSMTAYVDSAKFAGTVSVAIDEAAKDSPMMGSSFGSMKTMYDQLKGQNIVSVIGVTAQANGVQIDSAGNSPSNMSFAAPLMSVRDVVNRTPDSAWGFVASADLKDLVNQAFTYLDQMNYFQSMGMGSMNVAQLKQMFKQATGLDLDNDMLSWMGGEWGLYIGPGSDSSTPAQGGFVLNVKDSKDKATAAIQKINQTLKDKVATGSDQFSPKLTEVQVAGSTVYQFGTQSSSIYYGIVGDYFFVTSNTATMEAFTSGKGGISNTTNYKGAMTNAISNNGAVMYVNIQAIREFVEKTMGSQGMSMDNYNQNVKPFLVPFRSLGITEDSANGIQHAVIFLDIEK